jgi:hypothetical protein
MDMIFVMQMYEWVGFYAERINKCFSSNSKLPYLLIPKGDSPQLYQYLISRNEFGKSN